MPIPSFPINTLPEIMKNYVLAVAEHTQTTVDMAAVVALGTLATCNQKKFVVFDEYVEPLNLYTVIVAEPGERKSSVLQCFTKFLKEFQKEENILRKSAINQYKVDRELLENEIKMLKEPKKTVPEDLSTTLMEKMEELERLEETKPLRLFSDDVSPEALVSLLSKNDGAMSVISAESGIFDIIAKRYSSKPNLDVFLKGHSGDEIMVDRKGSESIAVYDPALTFILAIQPDLLKDVMNNQTMAGRGLLARFCFAIPKSTVGSRKYLGEKIPKEVEYRFKSMITHLLTVPIGESPTQLTLCEEAKVRLEKYFYYIERMLGEQNNLRAWLSKHVGCVRRIAGNLHLATGETTNPISLQTIENAIEIGKYFTAHAMHCFLTLSAEEEISKAKQVLSVIHSSYGDFLTRREVFRNGGGRGLKKIEELLPYLDLLEEYGYIKQVHAHQSANSSKPSDLVFINPNYNPNMNY